jgi:hypothetical protein
MAEAMEALTLGSIVNFGGAAAVVVLLACLARRAPGGLPIVPTLGMPAPPPSFLPGNGKRPRCSLEKLMMSTGSSDLPVILHADPWSGACAHLAAQNMPASIPPFPLKPSPPFPPNCPPFPPLPPAPPLGGPPPLAPAPPFAPEPGGAPLLPP